MSGVPPVPPPAGVPNNLSIKFRSEHERLLGTGRELINLLILASVSARDSQLRELGEDACLVLLALTRDELAVAADAVRQRQLQSLEHAILATWPAAR